MEKEKMKVYGMCSIHKLQSGDTVQLYLSATKGLYQLVDSKAQSCSPDWTKSENQPQIIPTLIGAAMTEPRWLANGSEIEDDDIVYKIDRKTGTLSIAGCPVNFNNPRNITLTYKCKAAIGGTGEAVERAITILVREGGENSYWGHINADGGTVLGMVLEGTTERERKELVLEPSLWYGHKKLKPNEFTVTWKRTGTADNGDDETINSSYNMDNKGLQLIEKNCLKVGRDGVNGQNHFEAHFFVNGGEVEAEGIQIADNADTYYVAISGEKNVYPGGTVQLRGRLFRRRTGEEVTTGVSWEATVTDEERENEYDSRKNHFTIQAATGEFTMRENDMYVPNTGEETRPNIDPSKEPGAWIKIGDSASEDKSTDDKGLATSCGVTVQFIALV